ncbi:MAG: SHOCT domain-containing protein [Candidatus Methanoperedens sp.]|nr:SHOCT domain-containing protein [Candidatus Methanoperedens sp.]
MVFGMMDGYGFGGMEIIGMIMWFIFWILILAGLVLLIKYLWGSAGVKGAQESALEILKKRYAKGEINKEEFEEKKKDLI